METEKAKEFIEGGMGLSIAFGEKLGELVSSAREAGEINHIESDSMIACLMDFQAVKLNAIVQKLFHRGLIMETISEVIRGIDDTLRANPSVAVDALMELTMPEVIESIAHLEIPSEISHIIKVVGWNRPLWSIERMEASLVSEARKRIKKSRKGGKGK